MYLSQQIERIRGVGLDLEHVLVLEPAGVADEVDGGEVGVVLGRVHGHRPEEGGEGGGHGVVGVDAADDAEKDI